MKKLLLSQILSLLVLLLTSCHGIFEDGQELAEAIKPSLQEISADELRAKIEAGEDFLLIDVRQQDEYELASIPGAVNIPRGMLELKVRDDYFWEEEYLYTPGNDDEIVVYCQLGHRGVLSAHSMRQLGFTNVKYLDGGILKWDPEIEKNAPKQSSSGGCGG